MARGLGLLVAGFDLYMDAIPRYPEKVVLPSDVPPLCLRDAPSHSSNN